MSGTSLCSGLRLEPPKGASRLILLGSATNIAGRAPRLFHYHTAVQLSEILEWIKRKLHPQSFVASLQVLYLV